MQLDLGHFPNPDNLDWTLFVHPLAMRERHTRVVDGEEEEMLDMWTVSSILTFCAVADKNNNVARERFLNLISSANSLIDPNSLLESCKRQDVAAIKQALALIATELDHQAKIMLGYYESEK